MDFFNLLETKKRHKLLGFLVSLAGHYWYLSGVKEALNG
jgi:hypothetical protein